MLNFKIDLEQKSLLSHLFPKVVSQLNKIFWNVIGQEHFGPNMGYVICARIQQITTKFFNKSKKSIAGAFLGQKIFLQKNWLCHAQHLTSLQHHVKIQKKLMIKFHDIVWADGRTEGRQDRKTLFYRNRPASIGGSINIY